MKIGIFVFLCSLFVAATSLANPIRSLSDRTSLKFSDFLSNQGGILQMLSHLFTRVSDTYLLGRCATIQPRACRIRSQSNRP